MIRARWRSVRLLLAGVVVLLSLAVDPAQAHHALDGATPTNFLEGLISGLAHPVVGLDHLVFVLAAGLAAGALGLGFRMPVFFIVASIGGLALHQFRIDLPLSEAAVALSIVALGLAVSSRDRVGQASWLALFMIAGLLHGYAYGESIVGAKAAAMLGYLGGLALVQSALAGMTYVAGDKLRHGAGEAAAEMRHIGALLAVIGVVFTVVALRQGA